MTTTIRHSVHCRYEGCKSRVTLEVEIEFTAEFRRALDAHAKSVLEITIAKFGWTLRESDGAPVCPRHG